MAPFACSYVVYSSGTGAQIQTYDLDFDGDGVFEISDATSLPDPLTFVYGNPGSYPVTLRAHEATGMILSATTTVVVQSFGTIDAIIRERWSDLRESLSRQDVEAAVSTFLDNATQEKYRSAFTKLFDVLPQIAAAMDPPEGAVSFDGYLADYLVVRVEGGTVIGHHLTMMRDAHGVWKIADL